MKKESTEKTIDMLPPASRVARILRTEIRDGNYSVGESLDNERSLALKFNVSRGTIRQALDILESERLLIRQQGRGTFVASPVNIPAVSEKTELLGALVWEREYFFERIITSASLHASRSGYILTTGSNVSDIEAGRHIDSFINHSVRGVILSPNPISNNKAYSRLLDAKIPVVLLATMIAGCDEDYVEVDSRKGTFLAVKHLIDLGHTRIGYLDHGGKDDIPCRTERIRGYLDACDTTLLKTPEDWIIRVNEESCESKLRHLFKEQKRPTAIVTYNDAWAIRVIAAARKSGLNVPGDIAVTGFDDSSLAKNYDIPVTSVSPEHKELGIAAVDLLTSKIENPRSRPKYKIMIAPHLIIRESTVKEKKND